jgi:hypothetical protein
MSDPRRFAIEPDNDLERVLLGAAQVRAPQEARRRAVIAATAALATSGLAAGTATAAGTVAKIGSTLAAHWVSVAGVVGVAAVTAAVVTQHDETRLEAPPVATHAAPLVPTAQPALPVKSALPTVAPEASIVPPIGAPSTPTTAAQAPASGSTGAATDMDAELASLERARAALSSGDPARALSILDQYAARFPHAAMAPEAAVLRIEALVRAGDRPAAQRVADAFLASNPGSPYAARIRSLVGTNP